MLYLQQSGKTKTLNWRLLCCVATCSNLVLVFLQLSRRWAIYCTSSKSEQSKKFNSRHSSLDSASMLIYIHAHSVDGNMDEYRWEYSHHFWSSIKKKAICMNTVWFYQDLTVALKLALRKFAAQENVFVSPKVCE